jgi:hypothetical protein
LLRLISYATYAILLSPKNAFLISYIYYQL